MKHPPIEPPVRFEQTLVQAYQRRGQPHFSPGWVNAVMEDIRHLHIGQVSRLDTLWVIWRAAAMVAFVISLLMGVWLTQLIGHEEAATSLLLAEAFEESHFGLGAP